MKNRTCRNCGKEFSKPPGSPGYIDQCLECAVPNPLPRPIIETPLQPREAKEKEVIEKANRLLRRPRRRTKAAKIARIIAMRRRSKLAKKKKNPVPPGHGNCWRR